MQTMKAVGHIIFLCEALMNDTKQHLIIRKMANFYIVATHKDL